MPFDIQKLTNKKNLSHVIIIIVCVATLALQISQLIKAQKINQPNAKAQDIDLISSSEQDLWQKEIQIEAQKTQAKIDEEKLLSNKVLHVKLTKLNVEEEELKIHFETKNFSNSAGNSFSAFYFDEFKNIDDTLVYFGEKELSLPLEQIPLDSEKVCAMAVRPNLEPVKNSGNCLNLPKR